MKVKHDMRVFFFVGPWALPANVLCKTVASAHHLCTCQNTLTVNVKKTIKGNICIDSLSRGENIVSRIEYYCCYLDRLPRRRLRLRWDKGKRFFFTSDVTTYPIQRPCQIWRFGPCFVRLLAVYSSSFFPQLSDQSFQFSHPWVHLPLLFSFTLLSFSHSLVCITRSWQTWRIYLPYLFQRALATIP